MIKDHNGVEYKSIQDMCDAWGITTVTYYNRIRYGWNMEKRLKGKFTATDHLGNEYKTKKEMLDTYGVNHRTFSNRMSNGWSLKEALTKKTNYCKDYDGIYNNEREIEDHLGNRFKTVNEMCLFHGVRYPTFKQRMNKGLPLSVALKKPCKVVNNKKIKKPLPINETTSV